VLGQAYLDSSGHWEARVTLIGNGQHLVVARIVDPIGDAATSASVAITLTSPHAAPAIRGDFTGEGHADILLLAPTGALVLENGRPGGRTPVSFKRPQAARTQTYVLKRDGFADAKVNLNLGADAAGHARLESMFELVP
jgi:hypothetical protein